MEEDDRGPGPVGSPARNVPEYLAVEDDDDDGFSFPAPTLATGAGLVPVYPIFGRPASPRPRELAGEEKDEPETATLRVPLGRLLLEEREFRARREQQDGRSVSARRSLELEDEDDDDEVAGAGAGADAELDGVPPESYCLWAPGGPPAAAAASTPRCRKSGSTGSVLRWRSISDRLVGRSHSDGKEKFVFLHAPGGAMPPPTPPPPGPAPAGNEDKDEQLDAGGKGATRPLRYYYGRGRGGGAGGSGRRRSSYLPYKQELVGLFANVSGLRRSYTPF